MKRRKVLGAGYNCVYPDIEKFCICTSVSLHTATCSVIGAFRLVVYRSPSKRQ